MSSVTASQTVSSGTVDPASGGAWLLALPVIAFIVVFLVFPVASVLYTAFADGQGGFTTGHITAFLSISLMRESFYNSLFVGGMTVVLAPLDRRAAGLLHGALRVPRRDPHPDARRAAADHAAVRRRRRDAAAVRPQRLAQPAAERLVRLHAFRFMEGL